MAVANAQKPKYVAEGFPEDSSMLLNEFVDLNTVDFSEFASLWRHHHFSLIFMGRPDDVETCEFVNEIFRITSQYLFSPSFYQQVGAVYILYALYRNQISEPSIKIRIEMEHWKVIKSLRDEAILKKYRHLHYVIDYLVDHALIYVATQTLKGPLIGNMPKTSKHDESICNLKTNYKSDLLKYSVDNNLSALRDLQREYVNLKKNIAGEIRSNLSESTEVYEEAISEMLEIVNPKNIKNADVGVRRSKIKADAFMKKSKNRFGGDDEVEIDDEINPILGSINKLFEKKEKVRPRRRQRRVPKEERRVGRPRVRPKKEVKKEEPVSDDEIDISHLLSQQKDLFVPPLNENKKLRTKREPYYQLSPKRDESDESEESDEDGVNDCDSDDDDN